MRIIRRAPDGYLLPSNIRYLKSIFPLSEIKDFDSPSRGEYGYWSEPKISTLPRGEYNNNKTRIFVK
jgi:hypothetical protein